MKFKFLNNKDTGSTKAGKWLILFGIISVFLGIGFYNLLALILGNILIHKSELPTSEKRQWLLVSIIGYVAAYILFSIIVFCILVFN